MTKKLVNVFIAVFLALLTVFILFTTNVATASASTMTSENFPNTEKCEVIKSLKDGDKIEGKFFRFFVEEAYSTYEDGAWVEKNSYTIYLDKNKEQKIRWSPAGDGYIVMDVKSDGLLNPYIIPSQKFTMEDGRQYVDFYVGHEDYDINCDDYVTGFYEDGVDENGNIVISQRVDELDFEYSDEKPGDSSGDLPGTDNKDDAGSSNGTDNKATTKTPVILGGLIAVAGVIIIICEVKRK